MEYSHNLKLCRFSILCKEGTIPIICMILRPFHAEFVDYKGRTAAHYWFLFIASIVIVFLALMRLLMEAYQLFLRRLEYIKDWINFLEILTFSCTIVFVWIFHTDCFCPYDWQWQIGIIAVFLAWINLVIFVQKLPLTGIYVVMFLDIFYTFMRMIILSFLLVLSFSFAFYMLFYKPEDAASVSAHNSP